MQALFAPKSSVSVSLSWKEYEELEGILREYEDSSHNPLRIEFSKKIRSELTRAIMIDAPDLEMLG